MKNGKLHTRTEVLYFKRWSRKSFAIACSIGKVVHIGVLALHISQRLDEKCQSLKQKYQLQHFTSDKEEEEFSQVVAGLLLLPFLVLFFLLSLNQNNIESQLIGLQSSFFSSHCSHFFISLIGSVLLFSFLGKICHPFINNIFQNFKITQDES